MTPTTAGVLRDRGNPRGIVGIAVKGINTRQNSMEEVVSKYKGRRVLYPVKKVRSKPKPIIVPERNFYWAFGSNLNVAHMARRCPDAIKMGKLIVPDCALVFRGVADVTYRPGAKTPGGLWKISKDDERELDIYEGVKHNLYMKRYLIIEIKGVRHRVLFYQMTIDRGIMPPSDFYLDTIIKGYEDFNLPLDILDQYVVESWEQKKVTKFLEYRRDKEKEKNFFLKSSMKETMMIEVS